MDKLSHQLTQNIQLKNKLNHINHHYQSDYQTKRRRAVARRNQRLKYFNKELQAIDKRLLNDVGVESYKSTSVDSRSVFRSIMDLIGQIAIVVLVVGLVGLFVMASLGI